MPAFRILPTPSRPTDRDGSAPNVDEVRSLISEVLLPAHFFVKRTDALEWQPPCREEISWEVYRGRLLDSAQTRQRQDFEAWNIYWNDAAGRSAEPILSVKLDAAARQVHVVRAIHCYAWEGYHAGDNVYLSRETRKWVRELVGTIQLEEFRTAAEVRDELICLLFQAVVGCSRLPLTSVEAPLPGFSLGELAYFYRSGGLSEEQRSAPMQNVQDLINHALRRDLSWLEKTKILEIVLRAIGDCDQQKTGELFIRRWYALQHDDADFFALCRNMFNAVALSPYTDFAQRALSFIGGLIRGEGWIEKHIDILSYLIRQIARHLTAYDLVTFHHRGANYPDALLLGRLFQDYFHALGGRASLLMPHADDLHPREKCKRVRRRAVRSAWIVTKLNENLPVPDAPTSPGENSRVLPAPFRRVSDEQILQPALRTKRLFETETALRGPPVSSLPVTGEDLENAEELLELGIALFADRPLGVLKPPGEPDRTLILSYEAWSRSIALHRLELLYAQEWFFCREKDPPRFRGMLERLKVPGVPVQPGGNDQRPAVLSLADAAKVANDFLLLRTTRSTVREFVDLFDFTEMQKKFDLAYLDPDKKVLIVSAAAVGEQTAGGLLLYDDQLRRRLELQVDPSQGYRTRAGQEYPRAGLKVCRVWEPANDQLQPVDLHRCSLIVLPRD